MQLNPQTVHSGLHSPQKKTKANHMLGRQDLRRAIAGSRQLIDDTIEEFPASDFDHAILPFSPDSSAEVTPSMSLEATFSSHWALKMLIYLASNKALERFYICDTWEMIERAGITQLAHFSSTPYIRDTSLAAAMEYLFAAGIGAGHADIVSWLLDTGVDANKGVKLPGVQSTHLPLSMALENSHHYQPAKIVRLLLFHGASPVLICCEYHGSPTQFLLQNFDHLDYFSRTDGLEILEGFLEIATALNLGLKLQTQLFSCHRNEADANRSPSDQARDECFHKMDQLVLLMERLSAMVSIPYISLITPRSLVRAVQSRSVHSIRLIHKHGLPMDCCDEQKRFPLQAAVEPSDVGSKWTAMDLSCVVLLLELGASPDYNPSADISGSCSPILHYILHSAIAKSSSRFDIIDIVKTLIQRGAIVQGSPACGKIGHRTLMDCALSQHYSWDRALISVIIVLHDAGLPLPQSALVTTLDLTYRFGSRQIHYDDVHLYRCEDDYAYLCESMSENPSGLFLRSKCGWTALDYAVSLRLRRLETLLVENGVKHTRGFVYSQCDTQRQLTVEEVEKLISRVPTPRNTKQLRDLLFYQLIGTIRAATPNHGDSEHVLKLLCSYRVMPRSPKHDAYVIFKASLDADLLAMALELLPESYSSAALSVLIMRDAVGLPSRPEFTDELLRRRATASLNWVEDTRMFAMIIRRTLGEQEDTRIMEWFQKHDRTALEYANLRPSMFAIRVFNPWQFGKNWDDFDLVRWFNYGLKTSSYLGLLVADSGEVEKMSALLHQGFQPNRRICWSLTALQFAVMRGDRPMIIRLIEAGGDVNARPPWKDLPWKIHHSIPAEIRDTITSHPGQTHRRTALQLAVEKGDISITKLLLDHGADVNGPAARVRGATALQLACIKGNIDIVRLLISEGADVNAPGAEYFGRTALEGAAEHGRLDTACFLLARDCEVAGVFRRQYIRAVGFSRAQGHHVLSKLLQKHGTWTEEDEHLLQQTDLRDKRSDPHELEESSPDDETSEVDPNECGSHDETFPYEADDESDLEDCDLVGKEGDATPPLGDDCNEATDGSDRFDQSIESAQTESRPWDEFLDYDADGEEEVL
ncbi:hypothetical protein BJ166DRAFT_138281 [Pestalotiopsis sp. NC0098]|nr:hypothetical protein BJ166DRAFT_138281 [Pestalotiopsis sp. NC0098]